MPKFQISKLREAQSKAAEKSREKESAENPPAGKGRNESRGTKVRDSGRRIILLLLWLFYKLPSPRLAFFSRGARF